MLYFACLPSHRRLCYRPTLSATAASGPPRMRLTRTCTTCRRSSCPSYRSGTALTNDAVMRLVAPASKWPTEGTNLSWGCSGHLNLPQQGECRQRARFLRPGAFPSNGLHAACHLPAVQAVNPDKVRWYTPSAPEVLAVAPVRNHERRRRRTPEAHVTKLQLVEGVARQALEKDVLLL